MKPIRLTRKKAFFYPDAKGSDFGPQGRGHKYEVEVMLEGSIQTATGMLINVRELDQKLAQVLSPLESTEQATLNPENMATHLLEEFSRQLQNDTTKLVRVRLYEDQNSWIDAWN